MVITSMKGRASEESSPRTEVGEIDTRAPFQSVKAAVNLFGEVAVPRDEKPVVRRSRLSMDVSSMPCPFFGWGRPIFSYSLCSLLKCPFI